MNRTPSPDPGARRQEPAQGWQAMERRAAEQAREYHRRSAAAPAPEEQAPAGTPAPPAPPREPRKLLGRFSADQLLLAALLCLLVQEEADPPLILAVAYILMA